MRFFYDFFIKLKKQYTPHNMENKLTIMTLSKYSKLTKLLQKEEKKNFK